MTRVCLLGSDGVDLRYELLSRETARAALSTYELSQPFENAVGCETISLGSAVALLNDLNWYLVRFVDHALIREPSISEDEWLSHELAKAVRNRELPPEETDQRLCVFGVEDGALVEPMYVTRVDGEIPNYDLRDVEETVVVRVSEDEFST